MSKKHLLAKILSFTGITYTLQKIQIFFSKKLTILAYHRIYDIGIEDQYPFDPELISSTPEEFEIQMSYIKKHFNPITLEDVINFHVENTPLPNRPIVITFDDGHRDNFTNAFPILRKLDLPATIFLSTDYIGSNKIFWFDWIAHTVYSTKKKSLLINNNFSIKIDFTITSRRESTEQILKYLKTLSNVNRIQCLTEIKNQLDVEITEENRQQSMPLNWEQVIEMSNNRIEFGSHTVTHPILSKLNTTELINELVVSKSDIEKQINKSVNTIAYPVGGKSEFSQEVINECKAAKYNLGLSYISGIESLPIKNLFTLKRLHVERYTNFYYFKAMLALPSIFK